MPNRILREGILSSEKLAKISWGAEVFYRRLMSITDDYGRYHANCKLLRAACYPLQIDKVSDADIEKWLTECVTAALVSVYPAKDGKRYLEIGNFGQQARSKSKYPPPNASNCEQMLAGASNCEQMNTYSGTDSDSDSYAESETDSMGHNEPKLNLVSSSEPPAASSGPHVPTLAQAKSFAPQAGVDPEIAETWWHEMEGTGWVDRFGKPVARWQSLLTSYGRKWASNENRFAKNGSKKTHKPSEWDNAW